MTKNNGAASRSSGFRIPIVLIAVCLVVLFIRGCPDGEMVKWRLDASYVDQNGGETSSWVTLDELFSQTNIRSRLGFKRSDDHAGFDGVIPLAKARSLVGDESQFDEIEQKLSAMKEQKKFIVRLLLIPTPSSESEPEPASSDASEGSTGSEAATAILSVTWDAAEVPEPVSYDEAKLTEYEKTVTSELSGYNELTFTQLNDAGAIRLRENDVFDVVLQDLLRAEVNEQRDESNATSIPDERWHIDGEVFGAENRLEKANEYRVSFQGSGSIKNGGNVDPYRSSYTKWIWAIERCRRGENDVLGTTILDQLLALAKGYAVAGPSEIPESQGSFARYRVDGSVLTLAIYTALILHLEASEIDRAKLRNIETNLLQAMRKIEGVDPENGELSADTAKGWYTQKGDKSDYNLAGGRMLYFALGALLAYEEGNDEKAKTFLENGLRVKQLFEANAPKVDDYYVACYLQRASSCNARLCLRLGHDNWSEEWFGFGRSIKMNPPEKGTPPGSKGQWSNYYYFLGRLGFANSMQFSLGEFVGRRGASSDK